MRGYETHVVPKGRFYTIERSKGGLRDVLVFNGDAYSFANRSNAEAYAELLTEDHTITRNDNWLPVGGRTQGGTRNGSPSSMLHHPA